MDISKMTTKISELENSIETLESDIRLKRVEINKLELEIEKAKTEKLFQYCHNNLVGKYCQYTKKEDLLTFKWFIKIDKCEKEYDDDDVSSHGEAIILTERNDNSFLSSYTYDKDFSFNITSSYDDGLSGYFNAYNLEESDATAFEYAANRIKELANN